MMEGGLKVSIRPSGTEPKNKVYMEKASAPIGAGASDEQFWEVRKAVDLEVEQFSNRFMKEMLAIVGVKLPAYAMEISDLVALAKKQHFAETFIPGLAGKAEAVLGSQMTREAAGQWVDQELKSYGPDARSLVGKAFRSYLDQQRSEGRTPVQILTAKEEIFFGGSPE